jgi:hypothetical protein
MSVTFLLLSLGAVSVSAQTWYGLIHTDPSPLLYSLVELTDKAVVSKTVASLRVGVDEDVHTDAMRCLNGLCAFTTTSRQFANPVSFVYKVSTSNGSVVTKVKLGTGSCPHLHEDYTSGNLYTLCMDSSTGVQVAQVYEVSGASPSLVLDVSTYIKGGSVRPGQTTHCSRYNSMYVGVNNGGQSKDIVFTVDLTQKHVSQTTHLSDDLWRTLWARCDGSNQIGGVSYANGVAYFGVLNDVNGSFQSLVNVTIPDGLEPSGLLTESETEQSIAVFYPTVSPFVSLTR